MLGWHAHSAERGGQHLIVQQHAAALDSHASKPNLNVEETCMRPLQPWLKINPHCGHASHGSNANDVASWHQSGVSCPPRRGFRAEPLGRRWWWCRQGRFTWHWWWRWGARVVVQVAHETIRTNQLGDTHAAKTQCIGRTGGHLALALARLCNSMCQT